MILTGIFLIVLGVCVRELLGEFKRGRSLFIDLDAMRRGDDQVGDLLEFPRPPSWSEDDVLRTYAEIESL